MKGATLNIIYKASGAAFDLVAWAVAKVYGLDGEKKI